MAHGAMHNGKRTSKRAAGRAECCPPALSGGNFPHPRALPAALGARALGYWVPRLTPRLTRVPRYSLCGFQPSCASKNRTGVTKYRNQGWWWWWAVSKSVFWHGVCSFFLDHLLVFGPWLNRPSRVRFANAPFPALGAKPALPGPVFPGSGIPDPGWAGLAPCAGNFSGSWFRRVQISIQIDSSMRSTAMRDVGWSKVTCLPLAVINFTCIRHGCRVWTWVSL